jgi:RNA polymerase sigma factor (TIGR02999 family)
MTDPGDITILLTAARGGDRSAEDKLFSRVYDELRRIARRVREHENRPDAPDASSIVHQAYLRLAGGNLPAKNRAHFFAIAARTMRRLLVDDARRRRSVKRGGRDARVSLEAVDVPAPGNLLDTLEVDQALAWLATVDESLARVAELRVFAGLSVEEVALVTGVSPRTVKRSWQEARTHLMTKLGMEP